VTSEPSHTGEAPTKLSTSSDQSEVLLAVTGLSKSFPTVSDVALGVLHDVNLEVRRGEVVAIVGESGSGKSTLLHILGALDSPDSGKVLFDGESIFGKSDQATSNFRNKRIGFVFQFHHLLPEFSALENVMMPALVGGASPSSVKGKAEALLERVGLKARAAHRPGELSGGEKQRVAIARALINDPDLVLADEPTGNLDETTADLLHQEMIRLSRELNQTFVLVTHNKSFAEMADRTLTLDHGSLVQTA